VKLHNADTPWRRDIDFSLTLSQIASPVYYTSLLGLNRVLHELINICQNPTSKRRDPINTQGGRYGNALQAASVKGHDKIVRMLIDAGADVNAQSGDYGNALQAASVNGHQCSQLERSQ
jgi:hypothetical protein